MTWHQRLQDFQQLRNSQMELSIATKPAKNFAKTTNVLTYPEFYKLARWVEENHPKLKGLTQEQISKQASAETSLTVTINNVRAAATTLGLQLGHISRYKGLRSDSKDINRTLARAIVELYMKLGEEVPEALKTIATR